MRSDELGTNACMAKKRCRLARNKKTAGSKGYAAAVGSGQVVTARFSRTHFLRQRNSLVPWSRRI